ncbi:hypothetical protein GCM10027160_29450 [Streptomyces calidiresistens]|uniref:Helix-turn-helix domain-containing protein n=1 Tax=Streptomyces calidiresistens TaxID=1485586 RepID=A0A7W3XVS9_9ACTN|nr:helix-turn-helix transcriptional regulator [Streptomyces calidiresistens]MBB0229134.1 helix-turn-helix domain-containing protein [Streptomyces calidiresistens]
MRIRSNGGRIRERRLRKGLKLVELARRISYSEQHLGQVERDHINAGIDMLRTLATVLECDLADISTIETTATVPLHVGARVRELRLRRGMKTAELATAVGCSHNHLSQVETGRAQPSTGLLHRLVKTLDCTVDDLKISSRGRAA